MAQDVRINQKQSVNDRDRDRDRDRDGNHHTEHLSYGFILLPLLQLNASANFLKLDSGPSTLWMNERDVSKPEPKDDSRKVMMIRR